MKLKNRVMEHDSPMVVQVAMVRPLQRKLIMQLSEEAVETGVTAAAVAAVVAALSQILPVAGVATLEKAVAPERVEMELMG